MRSTAALAGAAFGADAAGAGPDNFVAAAMRTNYVHEHVPKRFLDTIGVAVAVSSNLRFAVVRRVTYDHIEDFFLAGAGQVRNGPIERLLFHLRNFFQRQFGLSAAR